MSVPAGADGGGDGARAPRVPHPPPPRVYLITDRAITDGRPLVDVVASALGAIRRTGVSPDAVAVQLREKDLEGAALLALARALRQVTDAAGARLFVNDRVDVALAAGADGVHLGGGSLPASEVRRLAPRLELALSTHAVDELRDAAATDLFSFAVFGPVFATPSKRGLGAPQGLDGLAAACAATGARTAAAGPTPPSPTTLPALPVLALGGIDAHRAPACFAAGAAGIACIRAVLAASDPTAALAAFLIPPRPRT